jgi:hypothetical protein
MTVRKLIFIFVQGRTASIDVEISTSVLLSGMALDGVHSFLSLLRIATNHQTTVYRFSDMHLFVLFLVFFVVIIVMDKFEAKCLIRKHLTII